MLNINRFIVHSLYYHHLCAADEEALALYVFCSYVKNSYNSEKDEDYKVEGRCSARICLGSSIA